MHSSLEQERWSRGTQNPSLRHHFTAGTRTRVARSLGRHWWVWPHGSHLHDAGIIRGGTASHHLGGRRAARGDRVAGGQIGEHANYTSSPPLQSLRNQSVFGSPSTK